MTINLDSIEKAAKRYVYFDQMKYEIISTQRLLEKHLAKITDNESKIDIENLIERLKELKEIIVSL